MSLIHGKFWGFETDRVLTRLGLIHKGGGGERIMFSKSMFLLSYSYYVLLSSTRAINAQCICSIIN